MAHSHDGIDWNAKIAGLRERDELLAPETAELARALLRPLDRSVIDIGSGAGGAAAAFADALWDTGGSVVLVDSAPELLAEAKRNTAAAAGSGVVVRSVLADAATDDLGEAGTADLVFASYAVHHLPDQLAGLRRLVELVRPGGRLAIVESGLQTSVLPWDVGLAQPGLEGRLAAARADWFREMRAEMPGAVRMPFGWSRALSEAGLREVRSWTRLVDRPAPVSGPGLAAIVGRLEWLRKGAEGRVEQDDLDAVDALLDSNGPQYVGSRDDVHYSTADAVHVGVRPGDSR